MPIISQNLAIPAGLANGQLADANQIIPLYNTLNAFNIPASVSVLTTSFSDDTLYTLTPTGIASVDWAFTLSAAKTLWVILPFSWSGGGSQPTITFRMNGSAVTAAVNTTNAANGSGMAQLLIGAHDTDVPRPLIGRVSDTAGADNKVVASADLPTPTTTSIGVTIAGTTTTWKFKHVRIWGEA